MKQLANEIFKTFLWSIPIALGASLLTILLARFVFDQRTLFELGDALFLGAVVTGGLILSGMGGIVKRVRTTDRPYYTLDPEDARAKKLIDQRLLLLVLTAIFSTAWMIAASVIMTSR